MRSLLIGIGGGLLGMLFTLAVTYVVRHVGRRWSARVLDIATWLPAALPGVVAEHAKGLDTPGMARLAAEFAPKWAAVRRAALAKPFGDPKALATSAGEMAAWCDAFLKVQHEYDKPVYTPEQAKRLAACTSLMPVTSIYRWQDVTQEAAETVMTAKTTIELATQVAARIGQLHSYDLPVIERWPVAVDEAVAAWVKNTTG